MKRDAGPDEDVATVDEPLAGPRRLGGELRLELLPLSDDVLCADAGAVDVVELLDEAGAVGAVVCVAGVPDVALVEALTAPDVALEPEAHGVAEASGCVLAGALLVEVEGGGSVLGALLLGSALALVLIPLLGLELSLLVDGLVGVTSGLGDALGELEEAAGLDFTGAGADELVFAAAAVDETDPADWADVHDATGAAG